MPKNLELTCQSSLKWPVGYPRTPGTEQRWSKFGGATYRAVSIADALERLREQISAFTRNGHVWRTADEVVTANLSVGAHGNYKSNQSEPKDKGVAVYFELDGKPIVLCCDKWNKVGCNIVAIAKTIEAMRGLERWGVTETKRAFDGFAALPDTADVQAVTCWTVLGIERTRNKDVINNAWRAKARAAHPDMPGGSHEAMTALNTARDQAITDASSL